jgi:hypothetical protein
MHGTKQWAGPTIGNNAADKWGPTGSNTSAADGWVWPEIKCEIRWKCALNLICSKFDLPGLKNFQIKLLAIVFE